MNVLKLWLLSVACLVLLAPSLATAGGLTSEDLVRTYQAPVAVDTLVATGSAFVTYMQCSATDNAAVAGTIQLRDAVAAGAGTIVEEWTVLAIDYTVVSPKIWPINATFATGVYLDFTTTSDVKCTVKFRQ